MLIHTRAVYIVITIVSASTITTLTGRQASSGVINTPCSLEFMNLLMIVDGTFSTDSTTKLTNIAPFFKAVRLTRIDGLDAPPLNTQRSQEILSLTKTDVLGCGISLPLFKSVTIGRIEIMLTIGEQDRPTKRFLSLNELGHPRSLPLTSALSPGSAKEVQGVDRQVEKAQHNT
jgi:hypothetical protein